MNLPVPRKQPAAQAAAAFATWLPSVFQEQLALELSPETHALSPEKFDLAFRLQEKHTVRHLLVEVKPRWLQSVMADVAPIFNQVTAHSDMIPLLAVPKLSQQAKHLLREASINHADFSGTLYIRSPGLYVDLRPESVVPQMSLRESSVGRHQTSVNPFSDTASVVLRLLLAEPTRSWRIQELANDGGMSAAWVTTVAKILEERGYATRSQSGSGRESDLRLNDPVTALQDWSDSYSWRANTANAYNVPLEYTEIIQRIPELQHVLPQQGSEMTHALTLLGAADIYAAHVQHEQVHLYTDHDAIGLMDTYIRRTWRGEPVARGGNVNVVQPYYKRSVFVDARVINNIPVVSPVQLYLDLVTYPVRGKEAASVLARTVLRSLWDLSSDQVRGLLP